MNKKDLTLVILAGGMGSRFGGLKQIAPMGPNGEFIIDYSVYDAVKAGFSKIVFLIKEENYEIFKETIGKRVEPHINVEYAFQKHDDLVADFPDLAKRSKPLGTAHALLCCKDVVSTPFAMINADDFYGRDAFLKAVEFLSKETSNTKESYGMISYLVKNTITEHGAVKRGICIEEDGYLVKLIESSVEKVNNKIIATPLNESNSFEVNEDDSVSMNFLLFTPSIFDYIEKNMLPFLRENKDKLLTCEYLIPDVLSKSINEGKATAKAFKTTATWYGVTYKEDTDSVRKAICKMVNDGEYPQHLWK